MQRLRLLQARHLNFQRAATAAKRRVTGHAQLHAEQVDDRAGQPLGGSQRQAINFFQRRHAEDGRVGIKGGLATLARARTIVPRRKNIFTDPDRETSALSQSFVILTPVTETVRRLLFVGHASRVAALPSP
jgi:hypothetical protein